MTFQDFTSLVTLFGWLFLAIGIFMGAVMFLLMYSEKNFSSLSNIDNNLKIFAVFDFIIGTLILLASYNNILELRDPNLIGLLTGAGFWLGGIGFLMKKDWARVLHYLLAGLILIGLLMSSSKNMIFLLYLIFLMKFLTNPKIKSYLK